MSRREDERLKNAMAPGKPRSHVTEVADEIFGITPRPLPTEQIIEIPLERISPSPFQVRSMADTEYIDQLAESIRENGMVAPVIVRKLLDSNNFELVAGHHRAEACRVLGLPTVKAVVRDLSDVAAALSLTIDNAVRKSLTDYERYKHIDMLDRTGACKTQEATARALGVSQSLISNLNAYSCFPAEALALLEASPDAIGSTYAAQLKPFCKSHPEIVTSAVRLMIREPGVSKPALSPSRAVLWISNQINKPVRTPRLEVKMNSGTREVRLLMSHGRAEIIASDLNLDAVEKLIRAHLVALLE